MATDGDNFVRFTRRYFKSIRSHWHRMADGFEVYRSVKHLKFWDQRQHYGPGMLLDHTYEKIKAIPVGDVYEVRLADKIGGQDNIRIVVFDPPKSWTPRANNIRPMRVVWILDVLPKKRNEWTRFEIDTYKALRMLIQRTFYT